jgi:transmembrane sensor
MSSHDPTNVPARDIRAVEAEAARWFVRLNNHPVSASTEVDFDAWLAEAPEHRACYLSCEKTVALTRQLRDDPGLQSDMALCARIAASESPVPRFGRLWARNLWNPLGARAAWTAVAAILVTAVVLGGYGIFGPHPAVVYQTQVGERRTIVLDDRSTVTLNTDTRLSVSLTAKLRRIDLQRGEAFFSVTHDKARPFEVWAGHGMIRAVGTQFGVEVMRDRVTVSVLEGVVTVNPAVGAPSAPTVGRLEANRSLTFGERGDMSAERAADVLRIRAWREGKLIFDDVPLAQAMAEYNRYTTHKVEIGSPRIGRLPVSGVLDVADSDSLRILLRDSLSLRLVEQSGSLLLIEPDEQGATTGSTEQNESRNGSKQ